MLIIVFSICNFGIFSLFLDQYKSKVQTNINNETTVITDVIYMCPYQLFSDSKNISWEDDNQEIRINGVLYDIASITTKDGVSELSLVIDEEETEIKKQFALIYDDDNDEFSKNSNNPIKLLKQFLALKFIYINNQSLECLYKNRIKSSIIETTFEICSVVLNNETPPPILFA